MATDTLLYVAFRTESLSKFVEITDPTKYFFAVADWQPQIGMPFNNGYQDIIEDIPVQAIGATGAAVMANVTALRDVLYQAARYAAGEDVEPILMDIIVSGSNPAKRLTQLVKGWDASVFLSPNFHHTVNSRGRADMLVRITRAGVLYHTAYRYENIMAESDFGTVAPTTTASGITTAVSTYTGRYGGRAYLEATKTNASPANFYINNLNFPISTGISYMVKLSLSQTNITKVTALFIKVGPVAGVSNLVDLALTTDPITNGTTATALLTSTFTGAGYLYFQVEGASGATLRIAEVLITVGNVPLEQWHPTYTELTTAQPFASGIPYLGHAQWRWSHAAYSPVVINLTRTGAQLDYRHPSQFMVFSDKQPNVLYSAADSYYQGSYGAPFTQVVEVDAFGGSVVRYTPVGTAVARSAWSPLPGGTFGSEWRGMLNILLGLRNNSPTTSFTVWVEIADYTEIVIAESPKKVIAANATAPTWYLLGIASIANRRVGARWRWCVQANAAAGTIDLNPIMVEKIITGASVVQTDAIDLGSSNNFTKLVIDHQLLKDRAPAVSAYNDGVSPAIDAPLSWWTSPIVHMSGNRLYGWMLAMNGAKWKTYLTGGATLQTWQIAATRLPAYPTPE